jgi:nucleotide-binding universal stress UspA family protein
VTAALPDWQDPLRGTSLPKAKAAIETILVPLDGSSTSKVALPVAKTLAQIHAATLHVVYVGEQSVAPQEVLQQLGLGPEELKGVVVNDVPGEASEKILQLAATLPAPLIVMCTHTRDRRRRASVGWLAEAVLASVPSRIVLVNPECGYEPWQIRRVLLAHDGSPTADVAIAPAAEIAYRAEAEVIALHIATRQSSQPTEPGSLPAPRYVDQPQHEWPAWAGEFVERMLALGHSPAAVNFKLLVAGGQAGSEVSQFARDNGADLVVLAWRGRWGTQRASTAKVVIRTAGCPVLLIGAAAQTPER